MSMTTSARRLTGTSSRTSTADRLSMPAAGRSRLLSRRMAANRRVNRRMDRESFSQLAESIARFLGTGRYLAIQTIVVAVWITLNIAVSVLRWDPYPFILLNLAFSTQAAYAAPLILLAQNRQDDRDRASLAEDRAAAARMREDTEFLTREVASLRLSQNDAATRQYVRSELTSQLDSLRGDIETLLRDTLQVLAAPAAGTATAGESGNGARPVTGTTGSGQHGSGPDSGGLDKSGLDDGAPARDDRAQDDRGRDDRTPGGTATGGAAGRTTVAGRVSGGRDPRNQTPGGGAPTGEGQSSNGSVPHPHSSVPHLGGSHSNGSHPDGPHLNGSESHPYSGGARARARDPVGANTASRRAGRPSVRRVPTGTGSGSGQIPFIPPSRTHDRDT